MFINGFPGLNRFPIQNPGASDACFVYTTARQAACASPGDPSYTIDLNPGLNFLSHIMLGNFSSLGARFFISLRLQVIF